MWPRLKACVGVNALNHRSRNLPFTGATLCFFYVLYNFKNRDNQEADVLEIET